MTNSVSLSVVVPSKNEEQNITRCLDSLIKHTSFVDKLEIMLVDCYSSDKTVGIANKYPTKILQLRPEWTHTPAAARYIGTIFASGEFIFFIDADMTLEPGFLEEALGIITKNENIAGIGGIGKEVYLKDGKVIGYKADLYKTRNKMKKKNFLGGAALYHKKALLEINGFNPYLRAGEENELAQRLRKKKYYLISIPLPMIVHYTASISEWQEFIHKKRMNLFLGIGEAIRISHSVRYLVETLLYYKEFGIFLVFILLQFLILTYGFISGKLYYTGLILSLPLLMYLYLIIKKRSPKDALVSLIKWLVISIDITYGLIMPPKDPKKYPTNPYIIKGNFNV